MGNIPLMGQVCFQTKPLTNSGVRAIFDDMSQRLDRDNTMMLSVLVDFRSKGKYKQALLLSALSIDPDATIGTGVSYGAGLS